MACFLAFWPRHPGSLLMLMIQIPYKSNGVFRLYLIQTSSVHCNRLQIVLKGHRCEPVAPCTQLYEVEARANVVDVPKTWEKSFTMGGIDFMHTFIYIYMHTPEKIMFQKFINMRLNQTFVQETDQQHRKDTSKHAVLHSYQSGQPVGSKRSLVGSIRCMAAVRAGRVDSNAGGSWAINQLEFSWVTFTGLKKKQSRTNCTATYQESCYLFFATLGVWVAWMFIHCSTPKLWPSSASGILNASYMM